MSNFLKEQSRILVTVAGAISVIVAALIAANATAKTQQFAATATKEAEIQGTSIANVIRETVNAIEPESVEIEVTRLIFETEEIEVTREVEITRIIEVEIEATRLITVEVPSLTPDPPPVTVQITNPSNGSTVDQNTNVTFDIIGELPDGYRPIIIAHPLPDFPYYPWWQPDLVSSGGWFQSLIVGSSTDAGVSFEIHVLIISESIVSNATEFTNLPPSLAGSVVTVTRR